MTTTMLDATENFVLPRTHPDVPAESPYAEPIREGSDYSERAILTQYRTESKGIWTNPRLTQEGKRAELRELALAAAKRSSDYFTPRLERLTAEKNRTEGNLVSPQARRRLDASVNPEDAKLIEAQIRAKLEAMPEDRRHLVYLEAAGRGDTHFMRVVELAPDAFPLVSDEKVRAKAAEAYAAAKWPADYARLQQIRATVDSLTYTQARTAQHLQRMAGADLGLIPQ